MTISAAPQQPQGQFVFQQIFIYKSGHKIIEEEANVVVHPHGTAIRTGASTFTIPMTTKVVVEIEGTGEEIQLQIRIPIRAATLYEAWQRYDEDVKANYSIGVNNELLRRGLVRALEVPK